MSGTISTPAAGSATEVAATGTAAVSGTAAATGTAAADGGPLRLRRLDLAAVAAGDPEAVALRDALVRRGAVPEAAVREGARATLAAVRDGGDAAVLAANAAVGGGRADGRLVLQAA